MAATSSQDEDGMVSGINITPFVDICLVLLIIFMVTHRIIDQHSMPMDLPKAANGQDIQLVFGLELHANGETDIDGKKVPSDESILMAAKAAQNKNPDLRVILKADATVQHGRVIHAIDLLKQAGVSKIAFGTITVPAEAGAVTAAPAAPPAPAPPN